MAGNGATAVASSTQTSTPLPATPAPAPAPAPANDPADPAPFAPMSGVASVASAPLNLDAARIPPIRALSPLSGLTFGNALQVGPILLLINLVAIAALVYFVRRRWLAPVN